MPRLFRNNMVLRSDYILRIFDTLSAILVKIITSKKNKLYPEALSEIRNSTKLLLGMDYGLVKQLSISDLSVLLKINESQYPGKCITLAELLKEDADIASLQGNDDDSYGSYAKSLYLFIEAFIILHKRKESYVEEIDSNIKLILGKLENRGLEADLKIKVSEYRALRTPES